jgi:hypothetical protein
MYPEAMRPTLIFTIGKKRNRATAIAACLIAAALTSNQAGASEYRCSKDPHIIGECFSLHGRLTTMANSRIKLWRIGTNRILGVQYPGDMPEVGGGFVELPANIQKAWDEDYNDDIFADFRVCPFTKSEPGIQQYVCIDSAEHVFVRKACYTSEGYREKGDDCPASRR